MLWRAVVLLALFGSGLSGKPEPFRIVLLRFRPFSGSRDGAIEEKIRASLTASLQGKGYAVEFSESSLSEQLGSASGKYLVTGFYEKKKNQLKLYGLIYSVSAKHLIDAYAELDEASDYAVEADEQIDKDLLIRNMTDRVAERVYSNPRMRARHSNLEELFSSASLPEEELFLPRAESSETEVFEMLEQEVVVTGSRTEQKLKEVPATIRVVSADEIRRKRYRYLFEVLRDQPGFDITFFQGLYGSIFAQRGLDQPENLRTLVFIDGVLDNNISAGSAYIKHKYNLHNAKRVEILYGPASSLYGANAFSGVINIITKDGSDIKNYLEYGLGSDYYNPPDGRPAPQASVSIGRKIGPEPDDLSVIVSGFWVNSEGPVLSRRSHFKASDSSYYWTDSYTGSHLNNNYHAQSNIKWKGFSFNSWQSRDYNGQSTFATAAAYSDDGKLAYWNTLSSAAAARYEKRLNDRLSAKVQVSYRETAVTDGTDADLKTFGDLAGPITITRYRRPDQEVALDAPLTISWSGKNSTVLGASASDQQAWNYNTFDFEYRNALEVRLLPFPAQPSLNPRNRYLYSNRAGYIEHSWRFLSDTTLTGGFRYDTFQIRGEDGQRFCGTSEKTLPDGRSNPYFITEDDAALQACFKDDRQQYYRHLPVNKRYSSSNPRFGLVHSPSDRWALKLLYGQAFRAPTVRELFSGSSSRITNDELRPEQIRTTEASLMYSPLSGLRTTLAAHYSFVKDIILLAGTDIHRPGKKIGNNLSRFQNAGKGQVAGFDGGLEANVNQNIALSFNYTYQQAKLFDVIDPDLRAHDLRQVQGLEKIENTAICRKVLEDRGEAQYRSLCGTYNGEMPRVAKHKFNLGASFLFFEMLRANIRLNWVDRRANIATNPEESVPSYLLVNANLGSENWPLQGMDITLHVFNVLNSEIYDPGFRDARGTYFPVRHPLPGRYIGWEIKHRL